METARLDRSCGKNKITLDREDLRKPKPVNLNGEENRKPKPVALDEKDSRKPNLLI